MRSAILIWTCEQRPAPTSCYSVLLSFRGKTALRSSGESHTIAVSPGWSLTRRLLSSSGFQAFRARGFSSELLQNRYTRDLKLRDVRGSILRLLLFWPRSTAEASALEGEAGGKSCGRLGRVMLLYHPFNTLAFSSTSLVCIDVCHT
jgi:hypothetical protein